MRRPGGAAIPGRKHLLIRRKTRWNPPEPRVSFGVGCTAAELPAIFEVAHPDAENGALHGYPLLRGDESPKGDFRERERPMRVDDSLIVAAPERGMWEVAVHAPGSFPVPPPEFWQPREDAARFGRRLEQARFDVFVRLLDTESPLGPVVLFGTELADRIATFAKGAVQDPEAYRAFGPGRWRVDDPVAELDAREHVSVHVVADGDEPAWIHTHGLIKFGRPEFEVYDVPRELAGAAAIGFLDLAGYVMGGALVEPGQTVGDPEVPIGTRIGGRDRDHWEDVAVLELVDAEAGLRAWLR